MRNLLTWLRADMDRLPEWWGLVLVTGGTILLFVLFGGCDGC